MDVPDLPTVVSGFTYSRLWIYLNYECSAFLFDIEATAGRADSHNLKTSTHVGITKLNPKLYFNARGRAKSSDNVSITLLYSLDI